MSTLRDDELSKRIFFAGLFGLPWLQMVHAMGYYSNQQNLVNTDSDVAAYQLFWVSRSRNCAIIVTGIWITWIILVQFVMPDRFPAGLFIRAADQGEYTGW